MSVIVGHSGKFRAMHTNCINMSAPAAKKRKTNGDSPIAGLAHSVVPCTGYDVAVGQNFLKEVPKDILHLTNASVYVVITDDNIKRSVHHPSCL